MQINIAPASDGVRWLGEGFKLFLKQPLGLPAMTVLYLFMHLPVVVPIVGVIVAAVLSPFATLGLMGACREVAAGRPPRPSAFFAPFQDGAMRQRLFRLGAVNAALTMIVVLLVTLAGVGETIAEGASTPPAAIDIRWANVGWQLLFVTPVLVLMWFAPMLAGWHGADPAKAMFGSVIACWRNRSAMLMWGLAVSAAIFMLTTVISVLLGALGSTMDVASVLIAPSALILTSIVQASIFVMYTTVIGAE